MIRVGIGGWGLQARGGSLSPATREHEVGPQDARPARASGDSNLACSCRPKERDSAAADSDGAGEVVVARALAWAEGDAPADLPTLAPASRAQAKRDVFIYMISGAKVRATAAAQALLAKLK